MPGRPDEIIIQAEGEHEPGLDASKPGLRYTITAR